MKAGGSEAQGHPGLYSTTQKNWVYPKHIQTLIIIPKQFSTTILVCFLRWGLYVAQAGLELMLILLASGITDTESATWLKTLHWNLQVTHSLCAAHVHTLWLHCGEHTGDPNTSGAE